MDVNEPSAKYLAGAGYKTTEIGHVPVDWEVRSLEELARRIQRGASPRPIDSPEWFDADSKIGWVRISDVTSSRRFLRSTEQQLSPAGVAHSRFVAAGSLIMSICATVGRPIVTALDVCIHDGFVVFDRPAIDQRLLFHLLTAIETRWSESGQTGSQMNLNTDLIRRAVVAVPASRAEQQQVSGALDDLDVFVEALEQLIAKKRQIKQGAMQELLTGKKRLPGFSGEWIRVLLGELVSFAKGRGLPKTWLKDDGANPCIHYGELFTDYGPVIDQVLSRTDCMAGMVLSGRHDVLMPTSDVTPRGLAKASCVLQGGIVLGGDILIIRPGHRLYGPFLAHFIRCAEAEVLQLVSGTTVFHLYASDVRRLLVALPSVDEQVSIARALADLDAELAALETKLAKARALKQGISEALLTGRIRLMPPAPQAAAA